MTHPRSLSAVIGTAIVGALLFTLTQSHYGTIEGTNPSLVVPIWQKAMQSGDFNLARSQLLAKNNQTSAEHLSALLWSYFATGNNLEAQETINRLRQNANHDSTKTTRAILECAEARLLTNLGIYGEARTLANSCYERHVTSDETLNRSLAADAAHVMGLTYHEAGEYNQALKWYGRSKSLRPSSSWNFEIGIAATLNNIGNILWKQGQLDDALARHNEALAVKLSVLDSSHIDVAASFNNIGVIYSELSDHETALIYHNKALVIRERVNPASRSIAHSYHNIADSFSMLGRTKEALRYVRLAIAVKEDILPSDHFDLINSYKLLARLLSSTGDFKESELIFQELFSTCSVAPKPVCDEVYIDYLDHIANDAPPDTKTVNPSNLFKTASKSKFLTPEKELSLILALVEAENQLYGSSDYCTHLETAIAKRWNMDTEDFIGSILGSGVFDRHVYLAQSLAVLSTCYLKSSRNSDDITGLTRVLAVARASLEVLEEGIASELPLTPPKELNDIVRTVSLNGIWARFVLGPSYLSAWYEEDLLLFSDYATNWSFQSAVNDLKALRRAGASESEIDSLGKSLLSYFRPESSATSIKSSTSAVHNVRYQDREVRTNLLAKYPLFSVFRPRYRANDLEKLKLYLEETSSTAVLYEHINDKAIAIVFDSNDFRVVEIGTSDTSLNLVSSIANLRRVRTQSELSLLNKGFHFFVQPLGIKTSNILLIRNSVTQHLPFESFVPNLPSTTDRRVHYLIDDYQFSYSLSLPKHKHFPKGTKSELYRNRLFAVYPDFDERDDYSNELTVFLSAVGLDGKEQRLSSLPGAQREVNSVKNVFKRFQALPDIVNKNTIVRTTKQPVEAELRSESATTFDYIHFATHSFASTSDPSGMGIVLETQGKEGQDGILFVDEVYSLELNAELVVLSSCEAAASNSDIPGLNGFAKGFIYAGARNLVASMWQSDDIATMVLMESFYSYLNQGYAVETSLRLAKLDLIEMGGPIANPYYWAGFIHIGAPSGIRHPEA